MRFSDRAIVFFAYILARMIASTVRVTAYNEAQAVPSESTEHKSAVLATWHGRTFIPANRYRNRGWLAMISTSRDGDLQDMMFRLFGWRTVRGSTSNRGAVEAALTLRKELAKGSVLGHVLDGPRGPMGVVHPGAVYLAQKAQCPLVPCGISSWPRWTLNTWDKYQVPKPFAHCVMIYGEIMTLPKNLDDAGRADYAAILGERVHALEAEAERLARGEAASPDPSPALRADPPRSGKGEAQVSVQDSNSRGSRSEEGDDV